MTTSFEEEMWKARREQPHAPTPGNPTFVIKEQLEEEV